MHIANVYVGSGIRTHDLRNGLHKLHSLRGVAGWTQL